MGNVQGQGRIARLPGEPCSGHVFAPKHAHGRGAALGLFARAPAFAVEKSLHVRQERDELVVVPLLELVRVAGELVQHLVPRVALALLLEHFPVLLNLRAFPDRHELQRPEQDLPKVSHLLARRSVAFGHLRLGVGR